MPNFPARISKSAAICVPYFLFRDAADGGIFRQHADILNIVQLAKDAQLGELGDARQEHEAQVGVAGFERTIEIPHDVAQDGQVFFLMHHVEQGGVVFVDEHHLTWRPVCSQARWIRSLRRVVVSGMSDSIAERVPIQCLQLPQM